MKAGVRLEIHKVDLGEGVANIEVVVGRLRHSLLAAGLADDAVAATG